MELKKVTENDLRNHSRRVESLSNMKERIKALNYRMLSIRAGMSDSTPVQGGGSRAQEKLINCIAEIERLEMTIKAVEPLVEIVERGLKGLSAEERQVLELFYINRTSGHVERLMELLNIEQAQVYRIQKAALYKLTISMYGITEY